MATWVQQQIALFLKKYRESENDKVMIDVCVLVSGSNQDEDGMQELYLFFLL